MEIKSTRFGEQEINPEKTIYFPNGIAGFEKNKKYHLFHENKQNHVVYYLQSIENPDLTLNTIIAEQFGMKYDYTLSEDYREILDVSENDREKLVSLCIISKTEDDDEINAHPDCPIIINIEKKRGIQIKTGEVKLSTDENVNKAA